MEQELEPAYYAIIPATVRYDKNVPPNAKLLYGEVTALCNKKGFCWASNQYFADLYEVHKDTVSAWVAKLEKLGYIRIERDKMAGNVRRMYLAETMPTAIGKNAEPIGKNADSTYRQKGRKVSAKTPEPIGENAGSYRQKGRHNNKDNNTGNSKGNNTENTSDAKAPVFGASSSNPLEEKKGKKAPPVPARPPEDTPIVTRIRAVVEAKVNGYQWDGRNGKAAQQVANKLRASIIANRPGIENEPGLDDKVLNAFTVMLERTAELPAYYQFSDLPNLNSKYNEILTKLKNGGNGTKPSSNGQGGRPVAPAHRTSAERVGNLNSMFDQFDSAFGGQHNG